MKILGFILIFVSPPFLKKVFLKWFFKAKIGKGVRIGWFSTLSGSAIELGGHSEVRALTIIRCGGQVKIGDYSVISNMTMIYGASGFAVGEQCYIGPQCLINTDRDVTLGDVSALGPRSMIFTHGSFLPYIDGYWVKMDSVTIGNHVWIAAGVFIHPGVQIANNVFVNSRSTVTGCIAEDQVIAGNPAKQISTMSGLKRKMRPKRVDLAARQVLDSFSELTLQKKFNIQPVEEGGFKKFRYKNNDYSIGVIPSDNSGQLDYLNNFKVRHIILSNIEQSTSMWASHVLVFDLQNRLTCKSKDVIHRELWAFMRMYFGITFRYE